jgi:hypothetical protein
LKGGQSLEDFKKIGFNFTKESKEDCYKPMFGRHVFDKYDLYKKEVYTLKKFVKINCLSEFICLANEIEKKFTPMIFDGKKIYVDDYS